jgi:hypothetical protein
MVAVNAGPVMMVVVVLSGSDPFWETFRRLPRRRLFTCSWGAPGRSPDDLAAAVKASKVAAMATKATSHLSGVAAGSWRLRHQVEDGLRRCPACGQWRVPQRCDGCEALAMAAAHDHGPAS